MKCGLPKYCVEQSNALHIVIKTNVTLMLNAFSGIILAICKFNMVQTIMKQKPKKKGLDVCTFL
jgi:hypothetical protein